MLLSAPPRRPLRRTCQLPDEGFHSSGQALPLKNSNHLSRARFVAFRALARLGWLQWAAAGAILFGFAAPVQASLGGNVASVESDRAQMNASIQVAQHDSFELHEMQASGGTVVDEYVSSDGKVFAVSWHGPFPPPMQQILGTYFQQYSAALQAQPRIYGRRPLNIQEQGLVVQTGGHTGSYFGRAYIPDSLPAGVAVGEIH
jgi:Protein of unknown function (DUF2844)